MSEIATYTFLPWLRQGIANKIEGTGAGTATRATIKVDVTIKASKIGDGNEASASIPKDIQIYGPGDVIGIDKSAIVKVEPRNWITNFEPNYLPYIDFYDEDFPWRYSPVPPNGNSLRPWLALIILKEDEFEDGNDIKDKPLPFIKLTDKAQLPSASRLSNWAHVHLNERISNGVIEAEVGTTIAKKVENLLNRDPDLAYSRIICPRKLEPKVAYHAFLVPAFENGRLAGLGETPGASATSSAWTIQSDDFSGEAASGNITGRLMPYYHRWYFRTGTVGDFEYLVRLLDPRPVDSRVGLRDMDVQQPGANIPGISEATLNGILKLGGALRIPDISYEAEELAEVERYRDWANSYPHPFQSNLAAFINLTDSYEEKTAENANADAAINEPISADNPTEEYDISQNPDPIITAPLYGRWHALTQRLLQERDNTTDVANRTNWVHDLNLDPRWRVAAGFGTKVIQENQESYMKSAWEQVGDILEANQKIRAAQLAEAAAQVWHQKYFLPLQERQASKWLNIATPVHARVIQDGLTVNYKKQESRLPAAVTSANMRKLMRPRGSFVKRIPFDETARLDNLVSRINEGEVSAAPPKTTPEGIQKPSDIADALKPSNVPNFLWRLLQRFPWIKWIPLILAIIIIIIFAIIRPGIVLTGTAGVVVAGLIYLYRLFLQWSKRIEQADSISTANQTPEAVDDMPQSPDFRLSDPSDGFRPSVGSGQDNVAAQQFKTALKASNSVLQQAAALGQTRERPALDINAVNRTVYQALDPTITIPRWVEQSISLPAFIRFQQPERFVEAMAYPKFELPMYKPLADYSSELFLPNINYVAQNSISLLETNQQFIEAYMVGLNHEFARELLWREYPTDQRGSYFRQFWDVSGFIDTKPTEKNAIQGRYQAILDRRNVPDLKENYQRLQANEDITPEFLLLAKQEILREELKDIKPLHYWSKASDLGDHDNRQEDTGDKAEVVLVIRGELLKKYPTAVIYAHRAEWQTKDENGSTVLDNTKERRLVQLANQDNPPRNQLKTPLYEAKVEPDIYFFGFDLTTEEAVGGDGSNPTDDPGWFFVIKERPGEPRFGLDVGDGTPSTDLKIPVWNDLDWDDAPLAGEHLDTRNLTGNGIELVNPESFSEPRRTEEAEKQAQYDKDVAISLRQDASSAELAYILYQVPVLVAIHASEMLPK